LEAISHAICEIVERDATALWQLQNERAQDRRRLRLDTVDDPACQQLLEKFASAEVGVLAWEIASDVGLPTFACQVFPTVNGKTSHGGLAEGYGCHPNRGIALVRALTEAAQSRLTKIAGSRDDMEWHGFEYVLNPVFLAHAAERAATGKAERHFDQVPSYDGSTIAQDVEWELQCLHRAGFNQVVMVDLTKPEFGIPVVKVVIPGLESCLGPQYMPGRRAQALLQEW
jgi:ribosomal protein S12 methylthiotransferase accessory factor